VGVTPLPVIRTAFEQVSGNIDGDLLRLAHADNIGMASAGQFAGAPRWPELFGEPLLASAALDRLTHGAHFVEITGHSFRAEHTKKQLTARRARGGAAA
jgi:hypothetical protein